MGQGDAIWERFGHNAIRIRDEAAGTDIVYNWGTFDFAAPDFLSRFLTGETRYWLDTSDFARTIEYYRYFNRSVWIQELALTPAQRVAMRDYVTWNAREENRYYRYDYFLDNCSTRVRDVIDRAIGGRLQAATAAETTATSFRWHTRRMLGADPAAYTGIQIALGQPADRPISAWEEMFLPDRLREHVRTVRVPDSTGALVPLVRSETAVFEAARAPEPTAPPSHLGPLLTIGAALGTLVLWLGRLRSAGSRAAGIALAALGGVWGVIVGIVGVVLILAWTATRHTFWGWNENLFLFQPFAFLAAILLPMLFLRGRAHLPATRVAVAVAVIAALALIVKALPAFDQRNLEIIALVLPIHLAFAAVARRLSRGGARTGEGAVSRGESGRA
jgi:hypothetical protein